MRFIGDVHGKFARYETIIKDCRDSVQVGDMGVGFRNLLGELGAGPPHAKMVAGNHRFIRGNHDNPSVCKSHSQWIKDGTQETTENGTKIMYLGGAWSIDWEHRTEGLSWWEDEQCSVAELNEFIDSYLTFKPHVMVTHDCPTQIAQTHFLGAHKPYFPTRTDQALQSMFEFYQPQLWIFGHWHSHRNVTENNTKFICLEELQSMDIDL
jgi:predicted phosphodiesterase